MWQKLPDYLLTLPLILKDYIPHQLLEDVDEEEALKYEGAEMIDYYIKNSNGKLRIYGTVEELEQQLIEYREFPLRFKRYPLEMKNTKNTYPEKFYNLKGQRFYCKQEYFFHLHHSLFEKLGKRISPKLLEYMKNHEKRLDGCYEFVKYDENIFEKIRKEFNLPEKAQNILRMILPSKFSSDDESDGSDFNQEFYLRKLDEFIKEYPTIFLPNHETKYKYADAVVRMFEDVGGLKVVMESELFNAINLKNPNMKPLESEDKDGFLRTIDTKEVFTTYRDQIQGIEFFRHKIRRTRHAAVPIPTPSGNHCILASDALIEILRYLTTGMNIFQKVKRNTWHLVPKYVALLEKYFPPDMKTILFINLDLVKQIKKETEEFWKQFDEKPVKLAKDVGPNGLFVNEMKKEMKSLGLTDIFPEITGGSVYSLSDLILSHKPNEWKTKNKLELLEKCQLHCFFDRFPSLKEFLHNQKACQESEFKGCNLCGEEVRDENVKKLEAKKEDSEESSEDVKKSQEPSIPLKVDNVPEVSVSVTRENAKEKEKLFFEDSKKCIQEQSHHTKLVSETIENLKSKGYDLDENGVLLLKIGESFINNNSELTQKLDFSLKVAEKYEHIIEEMDAKFSEIFNFKADQCNWLEKWSLEQKNLEEKAKKVDDLEKKMKEKNKEIENLKQAKSKIAKEQNEEIGKLKKKISKLSEENKELTARIAEKESKEVEEIQNLKVRISEKEAVEIQIKLTNEKAMQKVKEKAESDQKNLLKRQKQLESDVLEKDRVNKQLQETISLMSSQYEEQGKDIQTFMTNRYEAQAKTIKNLLGRISSISDPKHSEEGPCPFRKQLMGLRKMKDNLEVRSPLKLAKDISQRLISLSTRSEIQEMATYEYQQFEGKHQMLLQEVCGNIHKLKDYGDVMTFPPLPEYPSFSDQFVNEYWNEIEKQKTSTSSESTDSGVLEDSECLICFVEMTPEEKTLKCDHCRKVVHLECASKWLKIHRSCPHCRREQLDPNEFPALG